MQPNQNPDYSFLNEPNKKRGPTKKQRIMIVSGGGLLLIIFIIMLFSLALGGGQDKAETSLKLAQMHTELIRVSEIGQDKARGQAAKNLATTTKLTLKSSEQDILGVASKYQEVKSKLLEAGEDPDTDKTLTEAEQRSRFDEVFIKTLTAEIKEYQVALSEAFESSRSKSNKQVYDSVFKDLKKITDAAELSQ